MFKKFMNKIFGKKEEIQEEIDEVKEDLEIEKEIIKDELEEKKTDLEEKTETTGKEAKEKVGEVEARLEIKKEVVEDKLKEEKAELEEKAETIGKDAKEKVEEVEARLEIKKEVVEDKLKEEKADLEEKAETIGKEAKEKVEEVEARLEIKKEVVEDKLKEEKAELEEKAETIGKEAKEKVGEVEARLEIKKEVVEDKLKEEKADLEEKTETIGKEAKEKVGEVEPRPELEREVVEDKPEEEIKEKPKKLGFFEKLKEGLSKTRDNFTGQISNIIKSYQKVDEELFEELEEVLITADIGVETTMDLIDNLRDRVKEEKVSEPEAVMGLLKTEIEKIMLREDLDYEMNLDPAPAVILVVGVNGVGKTTTIGKMAARYKSEGKKVLIAAGDTFRAAAIEQLEEWGNRAGVDIVSHSEGADPAAVIFDGIQAAKARNSDLLICDTAGRLHNKANLMNELNKIFRVLEREYPEAKKEILLVLDATTGQNAMAQAKVFKEAANITGIALTKLDGTAKGGVVIALQSELGVPIKFVGVGEAIDDLQVFKAKDFIEAIFEK